MKKDNKRKAISKSKQVIKLPFVKRLLKKQAETQIIPESQLSKRLKVH